jgi:hypothetical protein
MLKASKYERELIDRFIESVRALPDVHAKLSKRPARVAGKREYDAEVDLRVAGKPVQVLIEAKKAVYPRDARQVVWQLREYVRGRHAGEDAVPLLVAESISPGAKDLLRAERIGYYDSGGSLYLPAQGAYLFIDKPPPKSMARSIRSLFSGRRAQVLHCLLVRHQDWLGVKDVAEQALVSPGTASQVLTELERLDWLASRGQGPNKQRHLKEPAALLDAWAKQMPSMRPEALRRYFVPSIKATELLDRVAQSFAAHDAEYAITHEAAAQRYAPFLSSVAQVRCRVLVGSAAEVAIAELSARSVSEGANLAIIVAKSPGELLFREQVGGAYLASPFQVYLDLLRGDGRAKEMAEHLRKEKIGF